MKRNLLPAMFAVTLATMWPALAGEVQPGALKSADRDRIVSIGGAVTETLYALGLADKIVAVDTTSTFPRNALRDKPNVGYMRALSAEGVLSLSPSMILATEGSGPAETVTLLKKASIPYVTVPSQASEKGVMEKIRYIATAVDAGERGEKLVAEIEGKFEALAASRERLERRKRALFVIAIRSGRIMVAGSDTSAEAILNLAGIDNAVEGFAGYKPVGDEAIIAAAPDMIVMMDRGAHTLSADDLFNMSGMVRTPAAETRNLVTMEGTLMLGFGPRAPEAAARLASAAYPDMDWNAAIGQ